MKTEPEWGFTEPDLNNPQWVDFWIQMKLDMLLVEEVMRRVKEIKNGKCDKP